MKKIIALLLTLTLIMSGFTACGSGEENKPAGNESVAGTDVDADEEADEPEGEDEEKTDSDKAEEEDSEKEDAEDEKDGSGDKATSGSSKPSSGSSKPSSGSSKPSSGSTGSSKPSSGGSTGTGKPAKPADKDDEIKAPSGTPSEIIDKIYAKKSVDLSLVTNTVDLSDTEMAKSITGISSLDKVESAAYSESMMGSQAYSLVVVKVKNKKNTKTIANEMLNGIDQSKWICVTADDLRVAAAGDVVVLIMVDSQFEETVTAKGIVDAFKSLCGGLDVSLKK